MTGVSKAYIWLTETMNTYNFHMRAFQWQSIRVRSLSGDVIAGAEEVAKMLELVHLSGVGRMAELIDGLQLSFPFLIPSGVSWNP